MRPTSRFTTWATALATTVGAVVALAGSPASAADGGGFWAPTCEYGRACIKLSQGRSGPGGPYWNVNGCGYHQVRDRYAGATAHGNAFQVVYLDGRWDEVRPWTSRGLDENNLVTVVNVIC
ncbi:hypothetical protein [Streptomyces sp. NPDC092952]|uniref:hypothetical protein n=1 Tax=Streptomyces sp. NPDC092952 TaxID=3366018 RepID=UPI003822C18D